MKKLLILITILLFAVLTGCATTQQMANLEQKVADLEDMVVMGGTEGAAASFYPASAGLIGGQAGKLDKITSVSEDDVAMVAMEDHATYGDMAFIYVADDDSAASESAPHIIDPDEAGDIRWKIANARFIRKHDFALSDETNTNITEAHILNNRYITNNGSTSEADLVLPALSYTVSVIFIQEEVGTYIMEINPPSGELFDHDGTPLDVNDCIDSHNEVGAMIVFTRTLLDNGSTWRWFTNTIRWAWVDTGATD